MNPLYLLIALCAAALAYIVYTLLTSDKKLKVKLESQFGKRPEGESQRLCGDYWREKLEYGDAGHHIDDITWDDLDIDRIFSLIDACQSSAGQECLYAMLREPLFDGEVLKEREELMSYLEANPQHRLELQAILFKMGKSPGNGLHTLCYDLSLKKINYPWLYRSLALLPLLFAGLMFLNAAIGAVLLFCSFVANMAVHYITKRRLARELASIRYFGSLLWAAKKICKSRILDYHSVSGEISKSLETFGSLGGKISGMVREKVSDLDALVEYFRIVFLSDIRNYLRIINVVEKRQAELRLLYRGVGEIDALIAVLSFRKMTPFYACPEFTGDRRITAADIYHPLLSDPVLNSAELTFSLISGSNASGKSTFIKAAAVNGILAQTIHTCTARRFATPFSLVMSSMAVRDDITQGESYFIKEIKSLRRIIRALPDVLCACYIDEILKGTNTIERIAASAAVLKFIGGCDCICVVATHDIELTRMLPAFQNYHFSEQITENGVEFNYTIKDGPSRTKNAIRLLEHMEFDSSIIGSAEALVKKFEETQVWDVLH